MLKRGHEISIEGYQLIKDFEGCRLMPYQDIVGVWTDGWGNTHSVVPGVAITQEDADNRLMQHVAVFCADVNAMLTVETTQGQFDALVSFAYNLGQHALRDSSLLGFLNGGDYEQAARQFKRWNKAGGNMVAGLTRRRAAEEALFRRDM